MKIRKIDHANDFFQPFIQEIEKEVAKIMKQPLPPQMTYEAILAFSQKGSRTESETIYFKRRKTVVALALYLQWQKDPLIMQHFKNLVWDITQEYSWALPAHFSKDNPETTIDLFASETAHMLAEFAKIFAIDFESLLLTEINKQIRRRIITPFLANEWPWEKFKNNWSAVCAGAIGMMALECGVETKEREIILDRCLKAMDYFLAGYGDDGCCTEGVSYWVYGFGFYLYFAECYRRHIGISLLENEKLEAIASFPGKVYWQEQFVMFSDVTSTTHIPSGIKSFLKQNFAQIQLKNEKISSFHFDHCYRWAHLSRILNWSEPEVPAQPDKTSSHHFFKDAQWLIFKNEKLFFAAKGGHNDESHNHNDLGHFVYGIDDELTFVDFGAAAYSADYFGEKRYTYIQTRSNWHSVPTINDKEQQADAKYRAKVENAQHDDSGCKFKLDLSEAYETPTTLKRTFYLDANTQQLQIIDQSTAQNYQGNFVTYKQPILKKGKILIQPLKLTYDENLFEVATEKAVATNHFGLKTDVYATRLKAKKQSHQYEFLITRMSNSKENYT